jgi:polysaccharide deacetylase 2 family uncharacterized protein YibQ
VKHAFWVAVIAFALSALWGGYVSGRAAVPHFPASVPSPAPSQMMPFEQIAAQTDELADDDFAQDDAVAADAANGDMRDDARLTIAIVDAGHSAALESPFLGLGVPVVLVIDPQGPAARDMVHLGNETGIQIYVQGHAPLTRAQVETLHSAFPTAVGIAARFTGRQVIDASALSALQRVNWAVLDEYGGNAALARSATSAGLRFAARALTVDDHVEPSYVSYMLQQAVHLARGRRAVVMARPFPGTLHAFEDLLTHASRDGVRFVGL